MENEILTEKQKLLIELLPRDILAAFYLTGGTALSAFYLEHRFSEDLDFFTDSEEAMPPIEFLTSLLKRLPDSDPIYYQRLFDRRIFNVGFKDGDMLKVEFTVYPFDSIQDRKRMGKLTVDSLLNMVTGKLFAVTDRFDPKDFVDLYMAISRYSLNLHDLIVQTEKRFGVKGLNYVIPERLLLAKRIGLEYLPVMRAELDLDQLKAFFSKQAMELVRYRIAR